ncbi:hypothetical protein ESCO_005772 [Escovopsis weberi]|uniref:Uncharacterized protein n=1 Tax=Escovopsis weberi TaxID=150374 RepID=A0A0M8N4P9_ESCWE|nr:hypothetical protein ESCO_005772 [Escovopsis weberi]
MHLKHLLGLALVNLAAAAPQPANDAGLTARTYCPPGEAWNGSSCVQVCGADAELVYGECLCADAGKVFDSKTKSCSCPAGKIWDSAKQCVPKCGADAAEVYGKCVCKAADKLFDGTTRTCSCAGGKIWDAKQSKCVAPYTPPVKPPPYTPPVYVPPVKPPVYTPPAYTPPAYPAPYN